MTVNAVFLVGYAVGNAVSTQWWKAKFAPRYKIPWGIQIVRHPPLCLSSATMLIHNAR